MTINDQVASAAQASTGYNYLMNAKPYIGHLGRGDSGGPLIKQTTSDGQLRSVLIGIASQGDPIHDGVYTKVGSCSVWITNTIASN